MKRRTFLKSIGVFVVAPRLFLKSLESIDKQNVGFGLLPIKEEGSIFFVDGGKGTNFFNKGTNINRPLKTIDAAIKRLNADGSTIFLMPGVHIAPKRSYKNKTTIVGI